MPDATGPLGRKLSARFADGEWRLHGAGAVNPVILLRSVAFPGDNADDTAGAALFSWADGRDLGDLGALAAIHARDAAAAEQFEEFGGAVAELSVTTIWRLLIDVSPESTPHGTGLSLHPILGHPVVRSSAIRGAARAIDADAADRLFGSASEPGAGGAGPVVVSDATPVRPVTVCWDVVTPHHREYYAGEGWPAEWDDPVPVSRLSIEAGTEFRLWLFAGGGDGDAGQRIGESVDLVTAAFTSGLGAVTSGGYGYLTVKPVDLTQGAT